MAERPNLKPKTAQTYEGLVRLHLVPVLGPLAVASITDGRVRRWRKTLLDAGVGQVTVAKAYRLLKAILSTAVEDGMIRRNPCRIKGAGQEISPEQPILTVQQVYRLADAFDRRYRALILLAVFCNLRWGELAALQRRHIDLGQCTVRIQVAVVELATGPLVTGSPKSSASRRTVPIPAFVLPEVCTHLDEYTGPGEDALVFTGPKGAQLRRSNFSKPWREAMDTASLSGFHFHDLRHTGNHLASLAGASLRELMDRMGHSTTRAALIYLHRTSERDRAIADAMGELAKTGLKPARPSGTQRARKPGKPRRPGA